MSANRGAPGLVNLSRARGGAPQSPTERSSTSVAYRKVVAFHHQPVRDHCLGELLDVARLNRDVAAEPLPRLDLHVLFEPLPAAVRAGRREQINVSCGQFGSCFVFLDLGAVALSAMRSQDLSRRLQSLLPYLDLGQQQLAHLAVRRFGGLQ
jgi:hypothetical protein